MAEIRRKLVIVGDGACGKTCLLMYVLVHAAIADCWPRGHDLHPLTDRVQCLLQGHLPRGQFRRAFAPIPELRQPS